MSGAQRTGDARERILETAYALFAQHGIRAVGIDRIVAESRVAKMTLYHHFPSKERLVLAFLELREQRWTRDWLEREIDRRVETGRHPLLAIFDAFEEWFADPGFEGCPFLNTLLEIHDRDDPIRRACVVHLETIRGLCRRHAVRSGAADPDRTASSVQMLTFGAIFSASRGDRDAAARARELAAALVEH